MNVAEIEVHVGTPEFSYRSVRRLEARVEAATNFARTPTMEEANDKLRQMAAKVGANAIINVTYRNGASMTSWRGITATGDAVIRESEDYPCPICGETIKRVALKCRFCGAELIPPVPETEMANAPVAASQEPFRESNNSSVPYWIASIVVVLMFIIVIVGNS